MTFVEALITLRKNEEGLGMARRSSWPDGVVFSITQNTITFYHVAACALPLPPDEDLLKDDYIIVKDYGKDIGYKPPFTKDT